MNSGSNLRFNHLMKHIEAHRTLFGALFTAISKNTVITKLTILVY